MLESLRYSARAINPGRERKGKMRRFASPLSRVIRARRQKVVSMPEIKEPAVGWPKEAREKERWKEAVVEERE